MTQDEMIKLAREAGFDDDNQFTIYNIERFAALVAAHEREKLAEQEPVGYQIRVRPHGAKWLDWKDCSKSEYEKVFSKPSAKYHDYDARKLYAAPVRTKDLTDKEIEAMVDAWMSTGWGYTEFVRAVIAADREKNRG